MATDSSRQTRSERELTGGGDAPAGGRSLALQTLSIGLFLALLLAVLLAVAFGQGGSSLSGGSAALLIALLVLLFLVPVAVLAVRARAFARTMQDLAEATRRIAAGEYVTPVRSEGMSGEAAGLARVLDQVRLAVLKQRESFGQYRHLTAEILNGLGEGLLAINREKRVVLANRRFSELFYLPEDCVGRFYLEVLRSAPLVAAFEAALAGSEASESVVLDIAGARKQIEIRSFPLAGRHDVAAVAIFIDVTRLEQLERVRRDFVADFSHEVRTPLAGIRTAIETLDHGGLSVADEQQLRGILLRQLNRLETLVQEVGELKQIESGEMQLDRRDLELRQMLRSLCDDISRRGDGRVHITVEGTKTTASVDPQKIEQVFTNLVDNALRYGGSDSGVKVEVLDEPDQSVVRVIDYGQGIPEVEQDRIFQRFYRVDRSRSGPGSGTGLGLAIAKHLVLLHGGTIRVESQPGRGATFEVRLPKEAA
jgi:two-component system, OmpR family, phosphate regulon sensor histidine kinase PhoR